MHCLQCIQTIEVILAGVVMSLGGYWLCATHLLVAGVAQKVNTCSSMFACGV